MTWKLWNVDVEGTKHEGKDTERDTVPKWGGRRTTNSLMTGWTLHSESLETKDLKNWSLAAKNKKQEDKNHQWEH